MASIDSQELVVVVVLGSWIGRGSEFCVGGAMRCYMWSSRVAASIHPGPPSEHSIVIVVRSAHRDPRCELTYALQVKGQEGRQAPKMQARRQLGWSRCLALHPRAPTRVTAPVPTHFHRQTTAVADRGWQGSLEHAVRPAWISACQHPSNVSDIDEREGGCSLAIGWRRGGLVLC